MEKSIKVMETISNSFRSIFYSLIVVVVNIPVFFSMEKVIKLIKYAAQFIGIEV